MSSEGLGRQAWGRVGGGTQQKAGMLGSNMCRLEKAGSDGWQAGSLGLGEEGRVPGAAGGGDRLGLESPSLLIQIIPGSAWSS